MTDSTAVYRTIQGRARSEQARTGQQVDTSRLFTRHLLESFLYRLTETEHASDFVLKGGILLAAYGIRRPTKDVDAEAISTHVSPEHLRQVVADIVAVEADDGIDFDLDFARSPRDPRRRRLPRTAPADDGPARDLAWPHRLGRLHR